MAVLSLVVSVIAFFASMLALATVHHTDVQQQELAKRLEKLERLEELG